MGVLAANATESGICHTGRKPRMKIVAIVLGIVVLVIAVGCVTAVVAVSKLMNYYWE